MLYNVEEKAVFGSMKQKYCGGIRNTQTVHIAYNNFSHATEDYLPPCHLQPLLQPSQMQPP